MNKVELISTLHDNYIFLIINCDQKNAIIVDPGEANQVIKVLDQMQLEPLAILITHHHADHTNGVHILNEKFQLPTYTSIINKDLIKASHYLVDEQEIEIGSFVIQIIDLPGHTLGHNAYWIKKYNWLFSGDVIFGLGCGKLFEGSFEQAFKSLQKIKSLPDETQIYCSHEYTEKNLDFCKSLNIKNTNDFYSYSKKLYKKRKLMLPSVPLSLSLEKMVNPFLMCENVETFARLRKLRDHF